jgi:hypothetical protein
MSDTAVDWASRFIVASVRKDNLAALRLGVEGLQHAARLIRRIVHGAGSGQD